MSLITTGIPLAKATAVLTVATITTIATENS